MLKTESINVYTTDLGEDGIDLGKIYEYDIILLYLVHAKTRKVLGSMIRKLSVTNAQKSAQRAGTFSRRNPRTASAKTRKLRQLLLWVRCLCMRPHSRSIGLRWGQSGRMESR